MIAAIVCLVLGLILLCIAQWLKQNELEDRLEHIYELFEAAAGASATDRAYLQALGPAVTNVLLKHDRRLAELG